MTMLRNRTGRQKIKTGSLKKVSLHWSTATAARNIANSLKGRQGRFSNLHKGNEENCN
jgi:hypothetical protein